MTSGVTSPTAAPRRRLPRVERGRQLLDVADDAFAEHGIHSTSMDDIAELAGVTKPVVYDHFGSKDGLVAAVVLRAGAELRTAVLAAVDRADEPEQAMASGVRAYFDFMHERRRSWRALLTETAGTSLAAAALEQVRSAQAELIAELITADVPGCGKPRARLYAQAVIGACERLATAGGGRDPNPATSTEHVMDVIWLGLHDVREGRRWRAVGSSDRSRRR